MALIIICITVGKDFLEAGKKRLNSDTIREAKTNEVSKLKRQYIPERVGSKADTRESND